MNEEMCSGCGLCVETCPYGAIELEERTVTANEREALFDTVVKVAVVSSGLCKGCGSCGGVCPSGAIDQHCFKSEQLMAMLRSVLLSANQGK